MYFSDTCHNSLKLILMKCSGCPGDHSHAIFRVVVLGRFGLRIFSVGVGFSQRECSNCNGFGLPYVDSSATAPLASSASGLGVNVDCSTGCGKMNCNVVWENWCFGRKVVRVSCFHGDL